MEWDGLEGTGLLQSFESGTIAALVELRQKQWKESTGVVEDIRKLINQFREDFDSGMKHLKTEKAELIKEIEKRDCMIEGKQLEILGLRHQLKSLCMSKPVCTKCAVDIISRDQPPTKPFQDSSNNRKRARFNLSISSVDSLKVAPTPVAPGAASVQLHRRPSEKRRCLGEANNQLALEATSTTRPQSQGRVLVAETQNASFSSCGIEVGEPSDVYDDENPTETDTTLVTTVATHALSDPTSNANRPRSLSESPLAIHRPIGMATFSPPSVAFDASMVIRGAVNHRDLDNQEFSIIAPPPPPKGSSKSSRPSSNPHQKASRHVHKPSCRHFQVSCNRNQQPVQSRRAAFVDLSEADPSSDVTGADLTTFPSISTVETEQTCSSRKAMPPPRAASRPASKPPRKSKTKTLERLPSLGGSPTPAAAVPQQNIETQSIDGENIAIKKSPTSSKHPPVEPPPPPQQQSTSAFLIAAFSKTVSVTCRDCEKYYQSAGYTPQEIAERLRASGKHHKHVSGAGQADAVNLNSTPDGFWTVGDIVKPPGSGDGAADRGLVGDEEVEEVGNKATPTRWRGNLRRRRPLEFPKVVVASTADVHEPVN